MEILSIKPVVDCSASSPKFSFLYSVEVGKWVSPEVKHDINPCTSIDSLALSIVRFISNRSAEHVEEVVVVPTHFVAWNGSRIVFMQHLKDIILQVARNFCVWSVIRFDSSYAQTDEKEGQDTRNKERRATMSEELELDQSIARAVSMKYPDAAYIGVSDIDSGEIFFHAGRLLPAGNYTVVNHRHHDIIRAADGEYLIFFDYANHWFLLTSQDFNTPNDAKRFLGCHDDEAPTKSNPSKPATPVTPPPSPTPSPTKIRRARFLTPWQKKTIDKLEGKMGKNNKNDDVSQVYTTLERWLNFFTLVIWISMGVFWILAFLSNSKNSGSQKSSAPSVTYESAISEWESTLVSEKTSAPTEQKGTAQ